MRWTVLAVLLALAVGAVLFLVGGRPAEPLPVLAELPNFQFTERDGSRVGRAELLGEPWVADFIFTRCAIYCPRLTARMKELRQSLPPNVRTVSFSVDPDYDTPEVLSAYAVTWGIEGRDWLFLTGPRDAMWSLIRQGFLQPVEEQPEVTGSPILHSNRFVLVDGAGRMRGLYDAFEEGAFDHLRHDLATLDSEAGAR